MKGSDTSICVTNGTVTEILAGRYTLVAALVGEDLMPFAMRGWGLTALPGKPARVRLVLSAEDLAPWTSAAGRPLALTVGDPSTFRSVQLKGRAGPAEAMTDDDWTMVDRFSESFFSVLEEVEGTERVLLERLVPTDFIACTVVIDELFNQTPGPNAGASLGRDFPA